MLRKLTSFVCLILSLSAFAEYGPWGHQYFLEGGLLFCEEGSSCFAPGKDDVETLKKDWEEAEAKRLKRIEELGSLAVKSSERILEIAQEALSQNEESEFGRLYMQYGSELEQSVSSIKMDSLRLWVSKESPMFLKILELESLLTELQNQIDQQEDPDLKEGLELLRNEKYKEWLRSQEVQDTLLEMNKIQNEFFPKVSNNETESSIVDGLMKLSIPLTDFMNTSSCSPGIQSDLKSLLGNLQFSKAHRGKLDWDPIASKSLIKFIVDGGGFGSPLRVTCKKAVLLQGTKANYDKGHKLELRFKVKKENGGVTRYVLPSRKEIVEALKPR